MLRLTITHSYTKGRLSLHEGRHFTERNARNTIALLFEHLKLPHHLTVDIRDQFHERFTACDEGEGYWIRINDTTDYHVMAQSINRWVI